jgi:chloride channel 3/4/5
MVASITLRALNPHKTGKLVLFETNYGKVYQAQHYLVFVALGVCGGLWGGTFTRANMIWAKWFRSLKVIHNNPIFEVFVIVMITAALQYPNPATRARGDVIIRDMLVDCSTLKAATPSWVCDNEALPLGERGSFALWLACGTLVQLASTTISFGLKVPAGIIIPALVGGALFGRLVGQVTGTYISPGIYAMIGAAAFLAGVTRMTISLCVIMFELTGELEYVLPHMVAILTAKWTADALSKETIYDLAQSVIGHPFLNADEAMDIIREHEPDLAAKLIPPPSTMAELTVSVPSSNKVPKKILEERLYFLERRGLMDGGIVFVQRGGIVQGFIAQNELQYGLQVVGKGYPGTAEVRVLGTPVDDSPEVDLSSFVDRAPISIPANAPIEVAVELFSKLGIRYLCLTQEGTGKLVGFVIKKRFLRYMDDLKHHDE